jgi:solute carrier family 35, member F1/2
MLRTVLQGQLISLLITGTGVFASILSDLDANIPMLLSFLNYVLLSMFIWRRRVVLNICGSPRSPGSDGGLTPVAFMDEKDGINNSGQMNSIQRRTALKCSIGISRQLLGYYLGAALIDVEANFLIIQAYNYTSITSIMLLDCFTIPCAMGLSHVFLGCRYTYRHLYGVLLCILGLICIVISDLSSEDTMYGSSPFYGDLLCLLGSGLYAISNVCQEYLVKYHDRDEYLGFVGSCGAVISLVQLLSLNFNQLRKTNFTSTVLVSISGFVSCLFLMYINTSAFLQHGDSTFFNLSLLTSDIYAVLFSYFFYGSLVKWLYFVAFALVASGLFIYHSADAPLLGGAVIAYSSVDGSSSRNESHCSMEGDGGSSSAELLSRNGHIVTVLPSSLSSVSLTKTVANSIRSSEAGPHAPADPATAEA